MTKSKHRLPSPWEACTGFRMRPSMRLLAKSFVTVPSKEPPRVRFVNRTKGTRPRIDARPFSQCGLLGFSTVVESTLEQSSKLASGPGICNVSTAVELRITRIMASLVAYHRHSPSSVGRSSMLVRDYFGRGSSMSITLNPPRSSFNHHDVHAHCNLRCVSTIFLP